MAVVLRCGHGAPGFELNLRKNFQREFFNLLQLQGAFDAPCNLRVCAYE